MEDEILNLQQRLNAISEQARSYITGTIEYINDQWVFFEHISDEASLLEEMICESIEVFLVNKWLKGTYFPDGIVEFPNFQYQLRDGDEIRIKKFLSPVYKEWLEELRDEAFQQFIMMLNKHQFSLYDNIYCYNHLLFQKETLHPMGTNFIVFDNSEMVCNVLHHYTRNEKTQDRFEFTLCNGARSIISNIS